MENIEREEEESSVYIAEELAADDAGVVALTVEQTRAILEQEARARLDSAKKNYVASYDHSQDLLPLNSPALTSKLRATLELQDRDRSVDELLAIRNFLVRSRCLDSRSQGFVATQYLALGRAFALEHRAAGEFVYKMAETSEKIYVVVQGECRVIGKLPADEGGGDYDVKVCGSGDLFGDRALDHYGPRIDKVLALTELYVMSVTVVRFKEIAKTVEENIIEEFTTKEKVHNILSRPPRQRTRDDLGVVIAHVGRKLSLLQSIPYDGLIELFRTCDYVTSVGKQKLFKQGGTGQAMYIILTGFAQAFDRTTDFMGRFVETAIKTIPAGAGFGERALHGGGDKRGTSTPGGSCVRTLTYATVDTETALVVFDRDEYLKISKIIKHEVFDEKIALLRRTYVFQSLDLEILFELAQLMVPCSWKVDSVVASEGDVCDAIYIIVIGEMFVNSKAVSNQAISTAMNFGRIGPAAVTGEYCVLCEIVENEIRYTETITTRTNCKAFRISKHDFFTKLPPSSLSLVRSVIGSLGKLYQGNLWGLTPGEISAQEWLVQKSWQSYRNAVVEQTVTHSYKNPDITDEFRRLKDGAVINAEVTPMSASLKIDLNTSQNNNEGLKREPRRISTIGSPKRAVTPSSSSSNRRSSMTNKREGSPTNRRSSTRVENRRQSAMIRSMEQRVMVDTKFATHRIVLLPSMNSIEKFRLGSKDERDSLAGIGKLKAHVSANVFRPPFALVQFHKEKFSMRPVEGSRRRFRTYLRLCALVATCNDAKVAAEAQINYLNTWARNGGVMAQSDVKPSINSLVWTRFTGYSTIPLHHTDHFLLFCRGSPVEFTSFSPPVPIDLLDVPYPNACKLSGQVFGCLSLHRIVAPRPGHVNYNSERERLMTPMNGNSSLASGGEEDGSDVEDPLVMREISCVSETMGTSSSRMDSLRYASFLMESGDSCNIIVDGKLEVCGSNKRTRWSVLPDRDSIDVFPDASVLSERLVVVPMYSWIQIDEETFHSYDCAAFDPADAEGDESLTQTLRTTPGMETVKSLSQLETAEDLNAMAPLRSKSLSKLPQAAAETLNSVRGLQRVVYDGSFVSDTYKAQDIKQRRYIETSEVPGPVAKVLLKNERLQRTVVSDVDAKATTVKTLGEYNLFTQSMMSDPSMARSRSSFGTSKLTAKATTSDNSYSAEVEKRMAAVTALIAIRQRALDLNDEICEEESKSRKKPVKKDEFMLSGSEFGENNIIAQLQRESLKTPLENNKNKGKDGVNMTGDLSFVDLDGPQKLLMKKRADMFETLQTLPKNKSSALATEYSASRPGSRARSEASAAMTSGCDRSEAGKSEVSGGASSVGKASGKSKADTDVDALIQTFKKATKVKIDYAKLLADKLEVLNMASEY